MLNLNHTLNKYLIVGGLHALYFLLSFFVNNKSYKETFSSINWKICESLDRVVTIHSWVSRGIPYAASNCQ